MPLETPSKHSSASSTSMKTTSTLLLALALGLSTASAGLITDPLSFDAPIRDEGLTTDPLGQSGPEHLPLPQPNVTAASQFLASVIADGKSVRLSDLMLNPEFFAAAHAAGPEADALRGQIDWLMMTGVILGLDGDDGLADFHPMPLNFSRGTTPLGFAIDDPNLFAPTPFWDTDPGFTSNDDPDHFNDGGVAHQTGPMSLNWSWGTSIPGIILGGPGNDNIILGGPGNDNLAPYIQPNTIQPSVPGIILGGPGNDNIILGGPGNDNLMPTGAYYIPLTLK